MNFFTHRYQIQFSDTMAYGTHHFLTNFRFQCAAREALLFRPERDGSEPWKEQLASVELLTQQGYTRNLRALGLGSWAVIFMSAQELGHVSFRLCFRVLSSLGEPVACGYQSIVVIDRATRRVAAVPPIIVERLTPLTERATEDFAGDVGFGGKALDALFPEELQKLARRIARGDVSLERQPCVAVDLTNRGAPSKEARPNTVASEGIPPKEARPSTVASDEKARPGSGASDGASPREDRRSSGASDGDPSKEARLKDGASDGIPPRRGAPHRAERAPMVWVCPGQGSLDPEWTWRAASSNVELRPLIDEAEEWSRRCVDSSYISWLERGGRGDSGPQQILKEQMTLYLGAVLSGQLLERAGYRPACVLGHSMGEIAAAVLGGMLNASTGLRVVAQRTLALLHLSNPGGMLVVHAGEPEVSRLLQRPRQEASVLYRAVRNHRHQWVLAGDRSSLERCAASAAEQAIPITRLDTFAFHSPLLFPAAVEFHAAVRDVELSASRVPVFSPMEQRFLDEGSDWMGLWASHLVRRLDFEAAIAALMTTKREGFIECGRRGILTRTLGDIMGRGNMNAGVLTAAELLPAPSSGVSSVAPRVREATAAHGAAAPSPPLNAGAGKANVEDSEPAPRGLKHHRTELRQEPLAIVGVGCCLPGAPNYEAYRRLLDEGTCSILDQRSVAPELELDFLAAEGAPDKTYTLLRGYVHEALGGEQETSLPAHSSKIVRMAASALTECRAHLAGVASQSSRPPMVVIGSTADGCAEYDEVLALESLRDGQAGNCPALADALESELEARGTSAALAHHPALRALGQQVLGVGTRTWFVDAACASSLYALDVAARCLVDDGADLVYAGGAFAPGPSNSCLFSQFRGLSRTECRPLDARADGVVFGEGAAFVAVRRLSDALKRRERILAVVRGIGLSSDGRSASASAPQAIGQGLAIRRAYERGGLSPSSIQYVEAHATGTPVGDRVELEALSRFFQDAGAQPLSIRLGSVKSQISHVGWAAGTASLLKVVASLGARRFPAQHYVAQPNSQFEQNQIPFRIEAQSSTWPDNSDGQPRRAAVNGFGFGGSNSHVVLEAFDERYHSALESTAAPQRSTFVVANTERQLTLGDELRASWPPSALRLLPDVLDTMDDSQRVAVLLAAQCLEQLGQEALAWRKRMGVVVAMQGKTECIQRANDRIFRDRFLRILSRHVSDPAQRASLRAAIVRWADEKPVSGPYTLTGGMPNLAAGRVCQVLNLNGPNLTIDDDTASFERARQYAHQLVADRTCDIVMTIGLESDAGARELQARAVVLTGAELGLHVRSTRACSPPPNSPGEAWLAPPSSLSEEVRVPVRSPRDIVPPSLLSEEEGGTTQSPHDAVPLGVFSPVLVEAEWRPDCVPSGERVVLLVADASLRESLARSDISKRYEVREASPELVSQLLRRAHEPLRAIVLKDLQSDADALLAPDTDREHECLQPLLSICQQHYSALEEGRLLLAGVCSNAWSRPGILRAETGLVGGFIKSLGRELPDSKLVAVHTDDQLEAGLRAAEQAWGGATRQREIFVAEGKRQVHALEPITELSEGVPLLDRESVVVATGGARGITAELVYRILERFACRVVLLGRSDPELTPRSWRNLDVDGVSALQGDFYASSAKDGTTLGEARRSFARLSAAHEVFANIRRFRRLPGHVSYQVCDLTQSEDVRRTVLRIAEEHGKVDLIVHGAGVQTSSKLFKKTPEVFWATLDTKIAGLRHLLNAIRDELAGCQPHVHLATSAFSYFGNDGQQEYGAANEALNRLAQCMAARTPSRSWSSLAWLAWDGVGMTRGSEYRNLARTRQMRAMSASEGQALLERLLAGRPSRQIYVLASEKERNQYAPLVVHPPRSRSTALTTVSPDSQPAPFMPHAPAGRPASNGASPEAELARGSAPWSVSVDSHPYLAEHCVRDRPVVPACILLDQLAARVQQWSGQRLRALEYCEFSSSVRVPFGRAVQLVVHWRCLEAGQYCTRVEASVTGDITHNGDLLEAGRMYARCHVVLGQRTTQEVAVVRDPPMRSTHFVPDPYLEQHSPVRLGESFDCLRSISVQPQGNRAWYQPPGSPSARLPAQVLPTLLIDALLRVGVVRDSAVREVFVPTFVEQVWLGDQATAAVSEQPAELFSAAAQRRGVFIDCPRVVACSTGGQPVLALRGYRGHQIAGMTAVTHDSIASPNLHRQNTYIDNITMDHVRTRGAPS